MKNYDPYAIVRIDYPSELHRAVEIDMSRAEMEHLMTELAAVLAEREYPQHDLEFQ